MENSTSKGLSHCQSKTRNAQIGNPQMIERSFAFHAIFGGARVRLQSAFDALRHNARTRRRRRETINGRWREGCENAEIRSGRRRFSGECIEKDSHSIKTILALRLAKDAQQTKEQDAIRVRW